MAALHQQPQRTCFYLWLKSPWDKQTGECWTNNPGLGICQIWVFVTRVIPILGWGLHPERCLRHSFLQEQQGLGRDTTWMDGNRICTICKKRGNSLVSITWWQGLVLLGGGRRTEGCKLPDFFGFYFALKKKRLAHLRYNGAFVLGGKLRHKLCDEPVL